MRDVHKGGWDWNRQIHSRHLQQHRPRTRSSRMAAVYGVIGRDGLKVRREF